MVAVPVVLLDGKVNIVFLRSMVDSNWSVKC